MNVNEYKTSGVENRNRNDRMYCLLRCTPKCTPRIFEEQLFLLEAILGMAPRDGLEPPT
ncbi:hypothetical protein Lspi_2820 [Legionella spiritensis]|uniref:Uncharacterized protein n=1 Tax=Legionella spiritensis TaxID=452 RepID=A0A0W0YWB8_LEGSP|nr:hypothetical protein Lspi_2820 [Legionella spiritensis]